MRPWGMRSLAKQSFYNQWFQIIIVDASFCFKNPLAHLLAKRLQLKGLGLL